jgi:hypothetical protein
VNQRVDALNLTFIDEKRNGAQKIVMSNKIISIDKPKQSTQTEGIVMAEVKKVVLEPNEKNPTTCALHFSFTDGTELPKRYPLSFQDGPLRKDLETIMGRPLSAEEIAEGCDVSQVAGKQVPAVVFLKAAPGKNKLTPAVGPVFSLTKLKDTVAAL